MNRTVHEVLLVPALGHTDKNGAYARGRVFGTMSEADVVDRYVVSLKDELENNAVRVRVLETRKPPGVKEGERHFGILANTMILHCSIGWWDRPVSLSKNKSRVYLGQGGSNELSNIIGETMTHWGQIYCAFEHSGANAVADPKDELLHVVDTIGVRLEPFFLNGPHADLYLLKLEELGSDIGRCVADFIMRLGTGGRFNTTNDSHLPRRTPGYKISR